ncbi:hypothetical protein Tco_1115224, partial [Tanacetum coccineum]
LDNTAKTRRPQPRSNTKNDRVPSASKSSCIKNQDIEVEDRHRNLMLSKNKKHMSSECNNIKLAIRNDKSKVVCAMCKKCLITANHDVCVLNYVNAMNSRADNQNAKVINTTNQKKHKAKVKNSKKLVTLSVSLTALKIVQICLWCIDSGCSKHITGKLKLLINFVWKFLGTVRFGNDHIAAMLGYGDLQWGNILITMVYFVEGKSKASTNKPKTVPDSKLRLHLLHMDLCGPMTVEIINGKRVYSQRTRKIMETMNVTFDELLAMAFEQRSSKPGLQGITSRQIISELDLTYDPSTITSQKPTKRELLLLFEAMHNDYLSGQPSAATRNAPAALAPQVLQIDVDELQKQQHIQQQDDQAQLPPEAVAENVPNAMFNGNTFVNPFASPSTSSAESSSQHVDPSNIHTFYQPYKHDYQ